MHDDKSLEIFEILFEKGLDLNIEWKSSRTYRMSYLTYFLTSITKSEKILEWLLEHGAKCDETVYVIDKPIITFIKIQRNKRLRDLFRRYIPDAF